jgi:site-specific DNA-methyltransferase (adenine-specific)
MNPINKDSDLLELFASLNNHEVFTPPDIAKKMLDLLPKNVWSEPQFKFLDPAVKTGVFLREIFFRLFDGLEGKGEIIGFDGKKYNLNDTQERINHILKNMVFGISTSELTGYMGRRTLYGTMNASSNKGEYILGLMGEKEKKEGKTTERLDQNLCELESGENINKYYKESIFKEDENYKGFEKEGNIFYPHEEVDEKKRLVQEKDEDTSGIEDSFFPFIETNIKHKKIKEIQENKMKFDVIIGNPPYQINNGGGLGASADPIYQKFIKMAILINPTYVSMITPSRWFSGGKPEFIEFRKFIKNNNKIKEIVDFENAKECFNSVVIDGGVNYFLWKKDHMGDCRFSTNNNYKNRITIKTRPLFEEDMDTIIRDSLSLSIFKKVKNKQNISTIISSQDPFGLDKRVPGTQKRVKWKLLDNKIKNFTKIYLKQNTIKFIQSSAITKNNNNLNKYKVILKKAFKGKIKSKIIEPNEICSETFLAIFYSSESEAKNMKRYLETNFVNFILLLKKISHNTSKTDFSLVPDLPMTEEWTDEKLYKKYNLTQKEIDYIEESIAEMK